MELSEDEWETEAINQNRMLTPYTTPHIIYVGVLQMSKWDKLITRICNQSIERPPV